MNELQYIMDKISKTDRLREVYIVVLLIIFALVTLVCLVAVFRELKRKNIFAVGFAGLSALVFGWFTIMTIYSLITGAGPGIPGAH
jgi:uncharacterized membrane protein